MSKNLRGRNFLTLLDFTSDEIRYLLDLSRNFKDLKRSGTPHRYLEGKNIVLLLKRLQLELVVLSKLQVMDLGMGVTYLDPGSSQMGKKNLLKILQEY